MKQDQQGRKVEASRKERGGKSSEKTRKGNCRSTADHTRQKGMEKILEGGHKKGPSSTSLTSIRVKESKELSK